jgi:spore maturation protein CgeB
MRWLIVQPGPEFSVHDVFTGWTEALSSLVDHVAVFDFASRLTFYDSVAIETGRDDGQGHQEFRKAVGHDEAIRLASNGLLGECYKFLPDVALIVSAFFTPVPLLKILRARGVKIVLLLTESPYEDPRQLELAAWADAVILNDPVTMDAYRDVCPAVEYAPHAYRPTVHYPHRAAVPDFDLAFSGTGYESRIEFFTRMGLRGLRVGLAGNWVQLRPRSALRKYLLHDIADCLDNEMTADLYQAARAGINFYRREAQDGVTAAGWAMGPREVEMAACGLWFLRDPRPEGDAILPMLPVFSSPGEAGEKLRWWLARDSQREDAARAAREAISDRTFSANARMLLRLLDRQPVTIS